MLANNIWRMIESLFKFMFKPFEYLRLETDGSWWSSNIVSWVLIAVFFVFLFSWMGKMFFYKKSGKEDNA